MAETTARTEERAICYRCQLRLPVRLVRFTVGPRAGIEAICAACSPDDTPDGQAKRAEVISLRKERLRG